MTDLTSTNALQSYARAAYLALRRDGEEEKVYFAPNNLRYALTFCNFTDVADKFVTKPVSNNIIKSDFTFIGSMWLLLNNAKI